MHILADMYLYAPSKCFPHKVKALSRHKEIEITIVLGWCGHTLLYTVWLQPSAWLYIDDLFEGYSQVGRRRGYDDGAARMYTINICSWGCASIHLIKSENSIWPCAMHFFLNTFFGRNNVVVVVTTILSE